MRVVISRAKVGIVGAMIFFTSLPGSVFLAQQAVQQTSPLQKTVAFLPGYEGKPPVNGGTFTRALPADPTTLNPIVASDQISFLVYKWIFDPLVDMDRDMKPTPVLAEKWANSKDSLTTTFTLRKNVTWHDGQPFTADDVIFSYETAMDESVDAVNERPAFEKVAKVEKVDAYTVKVTWKEPYAPGLSTWSSFAIMPRHVYAYARGKGEAFNKHPKNTQPVGTGPFVYEEWKRGDRVVLKANEKYFRGRPHLDRVIFKIIPQGQTQMAAYKTGQLDLASISAEQWKQLQGDAEFMKTSSVFEFYGRQFFYIGFNQDGSTPPFKEKKVRQALAMALNRQGIVDKVLGGHGVVSSGPFYPKGWDCNPGAKPLPYDPARAGKLLDEAGWKDENGDGIREKAGKPLAFECLVPAEVEMFARWLEIFQQDWRKVGVDVTIRKLEWSVFLDRTKRHQFQAYLSGWGLADDPDPFQLLHSSQAKLLPSGVGEGQNDCSYANPEVDKLIEQEQRALDMKERQTIFWKLGEVVAEDQPLCFLLWATQMAAVKNRFQNVRASQAGYGLFTWYPSMLDWWVPREMQK